MNMRREMAEFFNRGQNFRKRSLGLYAYLKGKRERL